MIRRIHNSGRKQPALHGVRGVAMSALGHIGTVYYNSTPSADQQAYLSAHGIDWVVETPAESAARDAAVNGQPDAASTSGTLPNGAPTDPTLIPQPTAPTYESCDPRDSACVARVAAQEAAYQNLLVLHQRALNSTGDPQGYPAYMAALQNWRPSQAGSSNAAASTPAASTQPAVYRPSVRFTNLSQSNSQALQVGDTWRIDISGAAPNADVIVTGGQNGASTATNMGRTDGNGNFSLSGSAKTADIGTWRESWTAGNVAAGSFSFTVAAASQPAASQPGATAPAGSYYATDPQPVIAPTVSNPLTGLPWYVWAGGAAVLFLMLKGGRS